MGKDKGGPLTPKAIANRIKAKGLQKLRWFCQMCQKQCRDENGFKCHTSSESHQRQLLLFADNPDKFIDSFSKEFQDDFLKLLSRRCGTKRISANQIYQEYISDRLHVHMNATKWETLTGFVKWLGKEGLCKVDQTEKGWFITYIDRDPEALERQKALEAKEKMELDDADRQAKQLQKQIDRELQRKKEEPQTVFTELQRESEEEKVAFSLGGGLKKTDEKPGPSGHSKPSATTAEGGAGNALENAALAAKEKVKEKKKETEKESRKRKSAMEEIIEMETIKKEKISKKDYWLHKGIIVKVMYKKLGDKYYKKKAVIKSIEGRYVAVVKMLDSGDVIKIDQQHLETVIPAIGKHTKRSAFHLEKHNEEGTVQFSQRLFWVPSSIEGRYVAVVKMLDSGDVIKIDQQHLKTVIPAIGKSVLVVNGPYRGLTATMMSLDERTYSVSIELKEGSQQGRIIDRIAYEDISKLDV